LTPYLTQQLVNDLKTKFEADTLSDEETELVKLINDATAHYAVWMASPHLNLTIANMGIVQQSDTQGTSVSVDAWRYKHHYWKAMKKADQMLDRAIQYINDNLSDFSLYTANSHLFQNTLITTLDDFQKYVDLNDSYRTFIKLLPFIRKAERQYLVNEISRAQLDDLHTKRKADNLSDLETELLEKSQEVIANAALMNALPRLSILLDNGNAFMVSSMEGMNTKEVRHDSAITDLKEQLNDDTQQAINELQIFLQTNVDSFTLFKNSNLYTNFHTEHQYQDLNFGDGGVFMPDLYEE
jgi:hypothetical protein